MPRTHVPLGPTVQIDKPNKQISKLPNKLPLAIIYCLLSRGYSRIYLTTYLAAYLSTFEPFFISPRIADAVHSIQTASDFC